MKEVRTRVVVILGSAKRWTSAETQDWETRRAVTLVSPRPRCDEFVFSCRCACCSSSQLLAPSCPADKSTIATPSFKNRISRPPLPLSMRHFRSGGSRPRRVLSFRARHGATNDGAQLRRALPLPNLAASVTHAMMMPRRLHPRLNTLF